MNMERGSIRGWSALYRLVDWPPLYEAVQIATAPGAQFALTRKVKAQFSDNGDDLILDVGCGPESWLLKAGRHPVGLDIRQAYLLRSRASLRAGVLGSGTDLPFSSASFDQVWSVGVLHHLSDAAAALVIVEMSRVCRRGGKVVVMDSVWPASPWTRPAAHITRKFDRGGAIRTQRALESLLPPNAHWTTERFTYTLTGLEMLMCWCRIE